MTSNQIAYANYLENVRHNKRTENISNRNVKVGERNVKVGEAQVGLGYANLAEMYRHNYSTEQLTGQQTDVKQQEADTHAYEAETERMKTYAKFLPDWLVGLGYGANELMDSKLGDLVNNVSANVASNVHENPKRGHRKR